MRISRLLLVATALTAVAVLAGCSGQDADSAKPNATGSASPNPFTNPAKASGAPSRVSTPKPNFVVTTCRVEGLSLRLGNFSTNGDETSVTLYIKHVRGPSCTLSGYGSLALFSEDGSELLTLLVNEKSPAPKTIKLDAGDEAVKRLRWSTKAASDEPKNSTCGVAAVVLSVRLTEPSVAVDLYTKSDSRPDGMGTVCNHGRLMQTAWQSA